MAYLTFNGRVTLYPTYKWVILLHMNNGQEPTNKTIIVLAIHNPDAMPPNKDRLYIALYARAGKARMPGKEDTYAYLVS
jgi:hypothetical protein